MVVAAGLAWRSVSEMRDSWMVSGEGYISMKRVSDEDLDPSCKSAHETENQLKKKE